MIVSLADIRLGSSARRIFSDLNFSGPAAIWSSIFTITLFSVTSAHVLLFHCYLILKSAAPPAAEVGQFD